MKKQIKLLFLLLSVVLTGCYQYPDYDIRDKVGSLDLKTLPPEISEEYVSLCGDGKYTSQSKLYYQISKTSDFPKGKTELISYNNRHAKGEFRGLYYYRLCAISGSDTIYAKNIESFEIDQSIMIDQPLQTEPVNWFISCTTRYGVNSFSSSSLPQVLLSTDKEFKEYQTFSMKGKNSGLPNSFNSYPVNLGQGVTYYAKVTMPVVLGTVESETVSFTTENHGFKSISIGGVNIDGNPITDDLTIAMRNQNNQKWLGAFTAKYDESLKRYMITDCRFVLEDDTSYEVYAVTGNASFGSGVVIFSNSRYCYGIDQVPIYYGSSIVNSSNPNLEMKLTKWTCRLSVAYPSNWGIIYDEIRLKNDNPIFPVGRFFITSKKVDSFSCSSEYRGKIGENGRLSEDGSRYIYSFNIFPVSLNSQSCIFGLFFDLAGTNYKYFKFPTLEMEVGKDYCLMIDEEGQVTVQ